MKQSSKLIQVLVGGLFTLFFISHALAQTCVAPPDDLVSWWPGDGNAHDIQGAHDGTPQNGATFAASKVGQGFSLNGVNQFIEVSDSADWDFGSNDFTIDLWVNFAQINSTNTFVAHDEGPGSFNKWIFWLRNGKLEFHNNDTLGNTIFIGIPFSPSLATWYHVAVTRSGDAYSLYINGNSPGPITDATAVPDASTPLTLGMAEGGNFINGRLDEVEIFSRALSAEEIQALYNADSAGKCRTCTPPPADMVSWFPGDGNVDDIQGGNNGTLQGDDGAADPEFAVGKVGLAFDLDGVNDAVVIPHSGSLGSSSTSPLTIDLWVFKTGGEAHILGKREGCGDFTYQLTDINPSGIAFGSISGSVQTGAGYLLPSNTWTHLAVTYDGDDSDGVSFRLYLNGVQVATGTGTLGPTNTAPLKIGQSGECGNLFGGLIDEVEIFDRALSAEEIAAIADAGNAGKCICGDGSVDPDEECDDENKLDGDCCSSTCQFDPTDTACGDTGTACTNQDTCDGVGSCTDNGFKTSGTSCGDITTTQCNGADTCDGAGSCQANLVTVGTACGDTGTACTNQDTCDGGGSCTDNGFKATGTACGDSTDTACNHSDTCNGAGSCQPNLAPNGTVCSDGNACTASDVCSSGTCTSGAPLVCNDGNACTIDSCNPTSGCTTIPVICHGLPATICGTAENDKLIGTNGPDVIQGFGGNDILNGKKGNDVLCGGEGADKLQGGQGEDLLDGDAGQDKLLGGADNDTLDGGAGTDTLTGGKGRDTCSNGEKIKSCEP